MNYSDFKQKLFWITGSSSGIGLELGLCLLQKGCRVIFSASKPCVFYTASGNIPEEYAEAFEYGYVQCDVADNTAITEAYEAIVSRHGTPDCLVNNAGTGSFKPFVDFQDDEINSIMKTNFFGAVKCTQEVLPAMLEKGEGTIVNILSVAVLERFTGSSIYGASKAALLAMSRSLREEVRPKGIKILDVFPGATETTIWSQKVLDKYAERMMKPSEVASSIAAAIEQTMLGNLMIEEILIKPQLGNL